MKKYHLFATLITFITPAVFSAPVMNIQHWKTNEGVDAYLVKRTELPMVDIRVIFKAGSAYDPVHQYGVSYLTNALLDEGDGDRDATAVAEGFDNVGAKYNASITQDMAIAEIRTLTQEKYFEPALTNFIRVLSNPRFTAEACKRVRARTIATIQLTYQDPENVAEKVFYALAFQGYPYAHPMFGSIAEINSISDQQIKNFYKQYYVRNNMKIVILGDESLDQAHSIAEKIAATIPFGKSAPILKTVLSLTSPKLMHVNFPSQQESVMVGSVGVNFMLNSPLNFPLRVSDYIFGDNSMTSILFKQIRDNRGLAYYIYSQFNRLEYRGSYLIRLKTEASQSAEALGLVDKTLRQYTLNGPNMNQLNQAKLSISNSFPLNFDSNKDALGVVTNLAFYNYPLNWLDSYLANINAVTLAETKSAYQKILNLNAMVTVTVGPVNPNKKMQRA